MIDGLKSQAIMGPMSLYEYYYLSFGNSGRRTGSQGVAEDFQRQYTNLTKNSISLPGNKVSIFCGKILGQFAKERSSSVLISREQYKVSH